MRLRAKAHDERRNQILDEAWTCFSNLGYEQTTVAVLLQRLGIAKGTFYYYFDSKEAVLNAIAERFAGDAPTEEKVTELVRRAASVVQSLERVLGADLGTILDPPPEVLRQFVLGFQQTSVAASS